LYCDAKAAAATWLPDADGAKQARNFWTATVEFFFNAQAVDDSSSNMINNF